MESPQPVFAVGSRALRLLFNSLERPGLSIIGVMLEELKRRRALLKQLAMKTLTAQQQEELGLDDRTMLDMNAEATYRCLEQAVDIPESLDCWLSPYLWTGGPEFCTLNKMYNAGFEAVDIPGNDGYTALHCIVARYCYQEVLFGDYLTWFLSRGARADWRDIDLSTPSHVRPSAQPYPTLLFYLALIWQSTSDGDFPVILEPCRRSSTWVPAALSLIPDGCVCFCGKGGCLPTHMLWHCTDSNCNCHRESGVYGLVRTWTRVWGLSDEEKETVHLEVARLEVFERLGMAHTCCHTRARRSYESYSRRCNVSDNERARLQDEDSELALQLGDFLAEYKTARNLYSGTLEGFWYEWWATVDEILPPLTSSRRCKYNVHKVGRKEFHEHNLWAIKKRTRLEKRALERAGYVGPEFEDFREVIRVHFEGRDWNAAPRGQKDGEEEEQTRRTTRTSMFLHRQ
jgi:hypothetical protein